MILNQNEMNIIESYLKDICKKHNYKPDKLDEMICNSIMKYFNPEDITFYLMVKILKEIDNKS